jgi:hypothetical protein
MRQAKLLKQLYRACLHHEVRVERMLFVKEIDKILKRRLSEKRFDSKWTVFD